MSSPSPRPLTGPSPSSSHAPTGSSPEPPCPRGSQTGMFWSSRQLAVLLIKGANPLKVVLRSWERRFLGTGSLRGGKVSGRWQGGDTCAPFLLAGQGGRSYREVTFSLSGVAPGPLDSDPTRPDNSQQVGSVWPSQVRVDMAGGPHLLPPDSDALYQRGPPAPQEERSPGQGHSSAGHPFVHVALGDRESGQEASQHRKGLLRPSTGAGPPRDGSSLQAPP